ncbi:hypothetical protein FQZ97_950780 [compost metagenome]
MASSGSATTASPSHARNALRAANTQIAAPAYTRKLACMPASTDSTVPMGSASAATLVSAASA